MSESTHLVYVADNRPAPRFAEVDEVRLIRSMQTSNGRTIAAGSVGTVVLVLAEGSAFEVEFGDTIDDLLTVNVEDLASTANSA